MKKKFFIFFLFSCLHSFSQADSTVSVVSLENTKVVYRGIINRIKIAVPGAKSFTVTAPGELEKTDDLGNYRWNVTGVTGIVAKLTMDAVMPDGSKIHEERQFDIKSIN